MMLLWSGLALAHGGEDHGAPPPPAAGGHRVYAASERFEAALRLEDPDAGRPVPTGLLLADFATSAPIEGATGHLTLSGAGSVTVDYPATVGGIASADATFPVEGDYAGALVVTAPAATDLLAFTGIAIGHDEAPAATSGGWAGALCLGVGAALGAAVLAGAVGYAIGRRRGMAAAAALALAQQVSAHGGEDHGAPAIAAPAGGALTLPMESQFLVGLRTAPVVRGPFRDRVAADGWLVARPGESARLRAPSAGRVAAPPGGFPAPGSRVAAGDVLALLVPGGLDRVALAQARADAGTRLAQARADLALAERDAARADGLAGAISERERLERQERAVAARETVRQLERAGGAGGAGIPIRAPFAGTVGRVGARPGDEVEAGADLFALSDVSGLWLEVKVPERSAGGIAAGAPASVVPAADPAAVLEASVLDPGQEADPSTGLVTVTLAVTSAGSGLRPGFAARAWIGAGEARDAVVVPESAVVDSGGVKLAFVKTGPERFEAREVRVGGRDAGGVEVLAGVAPGERIVTVGTYALRSVAGR